MPPDDGSPPAAAGSETPPSGGAGGAPPGGAPPGGEQTVPYTRFQTQGQQLQAALEKNRTYETEIGTLRTQAGAAKTWQSQAAASDAKYESHFEIAGALGSFDPDIVQTVESKIAALPEAERAVGLKAILQSWKADPSKAPSSVRPHFAPQTQVQTRAAVDPHRTAVTQPNPPQNEKSAGEIYAMSNEDYIAQSNAERAKRGLPLHPTKK